MFSLVLFLIHLQHMSVAHDQHFIMWFFLIGEVVEILGLLILHLVEIFLRHLEELLEGHLGDIGAASRIHV